MTTSRALTDRILVPMVRVTADGLARLGLEPAPEAWDESGADPFAVATDGVSSTDSASPAEAVAIGFRTAAVPAPNASAEDAGTGSAIATNSLPSLQPRGQDAALPWPGERAPDPAMREATTPVSASAMLNHPDAVAIPAPNASAEDAGISSATAANSLPSLQPRGRDSALPWPGERAPDPAMHEAAAPASASAMINHPDAVAIPAPTASAVVEADNILTDLGYDNKMLTDLGYKGPAGERDSKLFGMPNPPCVSFKRTVNVLVV